LSVRGLDILAIPAILYAVNRTANDPQSSVSKISEGLKDFIRMNTSNTLTKKRQVMNHLSRGWGIDAREAKVKYGVKNLRATMSDIREQVERFGNWEIRLTETGRYFMRDTHPGERTYAFRKDGTRYMIGS